MNLANDDDDDDDDDDVMWGAMMTKWAHIYIQVRVLAVYTVHT
jgi:hypothetical protein